MNTRTDCFSIVIDTYDKLNDFELTETRLREYLDCQDNIIFYAFILHNNDEVTNHYHLVIQLHNIYSKKTIINDLANYFKCNKQIISCQATFDLVLSTQYLCHKNDDLKFHYDYNHIKTNDRKTLSLLFDENVNPFKLDMEYLQMLCCRSKCLYDIFKRLGLATSQRYLQLIKTCWEHFACERAKYLEEHNIYDNTNVN